jgi:UDP-glucose 4-epimerase
LAAGIPHFLFSSTAATYGVPESSPVREETPTVPINPYGWSKLMTERMLADTAAAHPINYCALRYFNVAGADPQARSGQSTAGATHLIKVAVEAALGRRESVSVFGTDYDTPDGTCIRDYVHVEDLVEAHILGLDHLARGGVETAFNLGTGRGFSVREVVEAVARVTGLEVPVIEGARRAGDAVALVSGSILAGEVLGWQAERSTLDAMIGSAHAWHQKGATYRA